MAERSERGPKRSIFFEQRCRFLLARVVGDEQPWRVPRATLADALDSIKFQSERRSIDRYLNPDDKRYPDVGQAWKIGEALRTFVPWMSGLALLWAAGYYEQAVGAIIGAMDEKSASDLLAMLETATWLITHCDLDEDSTFGPPAFTNVSFDDATYTKLLDRVRQGQRTEIPGYHVAQAVRYAKREFAKNCWQSYPAYHADIARSIERYIDKGPPKKFSVWDAEGIFERYSYAESDAIERECIEALKRVVEREFAMEVAPAIEQRLCVRLSEATPKNLTRMNDLVVNEILKPHENRDAKIDQWLDEIERQEIDDEVSGLMRDEQGLFVAHDTKTAEKIFRRFLDRLRRS